MKTDKEAVQRQNYQPEKSLPEAVKDPMLRPIPGPAPSMDPMPAPFTPSTRTAPAASPRATPPPSPYGPNSKGGHSSNRAHGAPATARRAPARGTSGTVHDNEPGQRSTATTPPSLGTPSSALPGPAPTPVPESPSQPVRDDREWL